MKKVVTPQTVAHLWANQEQSEARTPGSGNLFFNGNPIYSYGHHFEIARHVINTKGEKAVLFTTRTYSNTTSGHISIVRSASSHLDRIYVPAKDLSDPESNFNCWLSLMENTASGLVKAKKPEIYTDKIQGYFKAAERFAAFFGYEIPQSLIEASTIANKKQYVEFTSAKNERIERDNKIKAERLEKELKEAVKLWHGGKNVRISGEYSYLRINNDTLQTSQGININFNTAKSFYATVLKIISKGGCKTCNMRFMERYDVLEINAKFIRVGCHKIEVKEIKSIAKKLNWLPIAA